MKGLDTARGLRLFAGQVALYRESLQDFVDLYGGGLPGVDACLAEPSDERLARARREVHAMAGAAAALGAALIEARAREFESALRGSPGQGDSLTLLSQLRVELQAVIEGLRAQLGTP